MTGETGRIAKNPCVLAMAPSVVACSERELEELTPTQVRIKVEVSMVSTGTELHFIQETHTNKSTFPSSTGYISTGRAVGLSARSRYWARGQRDRD